MAGVYFDTSVFLAIFTAAPEAEKIRQLLSELKADRVRIYTSILTVQEVSVEPFRKGRPVGDRFEKVGQIARVVSIDRNVALTAAKFEAHLLDATQPKDQVENRRRKVDLLHVATAVVFECIALYSLDAGMLTKQARLGITLPFKRPEPRTPLLFPDMGSRSTV